MRKKKLLVGLVAALCVVVAGGSVFAVANWFNSTKNSGNTVTVGEAATASIAGNMTKSGVFPGDEVSAEYTVSLQKPEPTKRYDLSILDIVDGSVLEGSASAWEIAVVKAGGDGAKNYQALAESVSLAASFQDGDTFTVYLRLRSDASAEIAGTTLTFSLRMVEAAA